MGQPRTIRINGVDVQVADDVITGSEIKALAGVPEAQAPKRVLVHQLPDRNVIVPDAERIRVADGDVFGHHAHHSKAGADIEQFGDHMIETYLRKEGLHFYRNDVGEYLVLFEARTPGDTASRVQILSGGPDDSILTVRIRSGRLFELELRPQLESLCDRWNCEHRWPKAFVFAHMSGSLEIVAEEHLATRDAGVHQDMVDKFCGVTTAAGFEFWEWMNQQQLEPVSFELTDDDLDRLLAYDPEDF